MREKKEERKKEEEEEQNQNFPVRFFRLHVRRSNGIPGLYFK